MLKVKSARTVGFVAAAALLVAGLALALWPTGAVQAQDEKEPPPVANLKCEARTDRVRFSWDIPRWSGGEIKWYDVVVTLPNGNRFTERRHRDLRSRTYRGKWQPASEARIEVKALYDLPNGDRVTSAASEASCVVPGTPNSAPAVASAIADATIINESGTHQVTLTGVFSDADNDALTVTATSSAEAVATVSVSADQSALTVSAKSRGAATITVTAADGKGGTVDDVFTVTVKSAPAVASAIADVSELEVDASHEVSLSGVFSDADNDALTVTAASSDEAKATVSVAADYSSLTVSGVAEGSASVTVTAQDSDGNTVDDAFDVTVNAAPQQQQLNSAPAVASAIADATIINESGTHQVTLTGVFSDADNDALTVTATSSAEAVATVSVSADQSALTVSAKSRGMATITVTAADGKGGTVDDVFTVTVKAAPVVASAIADVSELEVDATHQVSMSGVFSDADGDAVTVTQASSFDTSIAAVTVAIEGITAAITAVTVTGKSEGTATITVTAQDADGNTVSDAFDVTVPAAVQLQQTQSSDATLSALTLSGYTVNGDSIPAFGLRPAFVSGTTEYAASAPQFTARVSVTATATNSGATIRVDGQTVASGAPSQQIRLVDNQPKRITVTVTAADGATQQTYTVAATGHPRADLRDLTLSPGELHPSIFTTSEQDYRAWTPHGVKSVRVTATRRHGSETLTVNGQAVTSGQASQAIALEVGENLITVVATAPDGYTSRSYTITVTRLTEAQSSDATLSAIMVYQATSFQPDNGNNVPYEGDPLTLTPAVSRTEREYQAEQPEADGIYVAVAVTTNAPGARSIVIDGPEVNLERRDPKDEVVSGEASGPWQMSLGYQLITIRVTSLDGKNTETYRLVIKRGTVVDDLKGLRLSSGDGKLTLSWDASDSPTAPTDYMLRWRKAGETAWLNSGFPPGWKTSYALDAGYAGPADGDRFAAVTQGSATLSGLENGVAYEVQARGARGPLNPATGERRVFVFLRTDWQSLTGTPGAAPTTLTVTPSSPTRVYGDADDLGYTVSGLKSGDAATDVLTGALGRASGEDAGDYAIGMGTLAVASAHTGKYALPAAPALTTYTITPRPITAISGVTVTARASDGTTDASFDTSAATGTGVLPAELADFRAGGLAVSGVFPLAVPGTHDVGVTYSLQDHGSFKAANYSLSATTDTLRGEITASTDELVCVPAGFRDTTDDPNLTNIYTLADLDAIRREPGKGYELMADLDFDTNGNGRADAGDAYWNGGVGWDHLHIAGVFDGNGHTISNLYINNDRSHPGLFDNISRDGEVRNLRLESVDVTTSWLGATTGGLAANNLGKIIDVHVTGSVSGWRYTGGLVGLNDGEVIASSFSGSVTATGMVGGLVGSNAGAVVAGCSSGSVTNTAANYDSHAGGLAGSHFSPGYVIASHSFSSVTAETGAKFVGGLVGRTHAPVTASYAAGPVSGGKQDVSPLLVLNYTAVDTSNLYWDKDVNSHFGYAADEWWYAAGKTTAQLQAPTGYTGIYANWNVDLDGDGSPDDPWNFGTSGEYPTLKYSGLDNRPVAVGRPGGTDYDTDDDGLIEISSLAQLNAVRWDVNGDGGPNRAGYRADYAKAYPDPATAMGCPQDGCAGYELTSDLDFDTNGSGAADAGDDYWNGGAGWTPIHDDGLAFRAVFEGNGHTISNLYINDATSEAYIGLFRAITHPGAARNVGLVSASVTVTNHNEAAGALAGMSSGEISGAYMTGSVSVTNADGGLVEYNKDDLRISAGGLVGFNNLGGRIAASYAAGQVSGSGRDVGGLVAFNDGEITSSYAMVSVDGGTVGGANVGGLAGYNESGGVIRASYAAGPVSGGGANVGGLVGFDKSRVSASYWDTETSGLATSAAGAGQTTAELQSPTGYAGIYANWNEDLDGDGSDDDPWDFGTSCQYPVLKYGSLNPDDQRDPCDPAGLPGPVTGLDLSATFDSVTVSWSAPASGEAPPGYIAHLRPEAGSAGSGKTRRPGADKTTVTFDNLESSQTYRVWVRAQNEAGKGERVHASVTLPTEPPGLVTGLTLTATEGAADSVTVSWQAPETGGAPDGYIAHLRPKGSAEGSGRTKRPKASKTQVTFGNLESGTTYKVWVRAENEAGKGERVLAEITLEAVSAYCPDPVNDDYDNWWHFGYGRPPYDESLFGVSRVHVTACVNFRVAGADDMAVLSLSLPEGVTIDPEFSSKNYSYRLTVPAELDHLTFTGKFTSELWGDNVDEQAGATLVAGLVGQYDAFIGNTEESGYSITIATNARTGNPNRIELAPDAVTMISIEMRKSQPGGTFDVRTYEFPFKTFYTLAVTRGDPPANAAPTVASPISDVSGLAAGSTRDISLSGVFSDADGDSLTVTATSSNDAIATVSVAADYSSLTVTGVAEGTATVTVTAQDSHGNQVSDAFDVSVVEAEITLLTITPNNPTREYGEADDLAYSVGGLLDGDAATDVVTGTLSRASGDDAGDYAIGMGTLAVASAYAGKYSLPSAPSVATYTITPRPVTAISGVTVASRAADGSATASFDTSAAAGTGVLPSDLADFRAGGLQVSGAFPSTAAGAHDVAATYSLQDHGSFKAANYSLSTTTATLRGEIAAVSKGGISCVPAGFKNTTDDPELINIYTLADLNSMYNVGEKKGYELMADLDFDTNGNGEADAGDTYWNGGSGFSAGSLDDIIFDGNGHTIRNLYIKGDGRVGLFSRVTRDAEIRNLRLESVNVTGRTVVGALAGWNSGKIIDVYATGTVNGNDNVGGLVGWATSTSVIIASAFEGDVTSVREAGGLVGTSSGGIIASCSSGSVTNTTASYDAVAGGLSATTEQPGYVIASYSSSDVTVASGTLYAGGLIGFSTGPTTASYATGRVSGGVNPGGQYSYVGALIGSSPELTDSYWNKDSNPGFHTQSGWFYTDPWKALGKTTRQLQNPTGYTGIYASWNVDLNGDGSPDDPWDFGASGEYPTLKYSGLDNNPIAVGRPGGTDYDTDDDGLIEISSLAQLNAVRWDINGDGGPNRVGYRANYGAAFPDPATAMGCPSSGCIGYELMQNLDLDTNDSGSADAEDDYWNGGSGWTPIEDQGLAFHAVFDGNGHTISNLYIDDSTGNAHVGLFRAVVYPGVVRNLGLLSASVTASYGNAAAGALVGMNNGEISGAYMTGSVSGSYAAGGLVGFNRKYGKITASYAAGSVSGNGRDVGGLVAYNGGEITAAYAIASVEGGDGVFRSEVERGGENVGGLVGYNDSPGVITASYAAGPVSGGGANIGGLVGFNRSLRSDSYWDTETSGQADSATGIGKTTAELQEPTGYAGIYAHWNVDLDGDGSADDPWDFGTSCQYPVLKYGSLNPDDQREPCEPTTTSPYSQVSAGHDHACALRLDGRIDCWGENEYGESTPPAGTFKQVSAGSHFTCAIKSGGATAGQVECWGKTESSYSEEDLTPPPSGTFTQIDTGSHHVGPDGGHACGVMTDGRIVCWGDITSQYYSPPAGTFKQVSTWWLHGCAVNTDDEAVCWGTSSPDVYDKVMPPAGTFKQVAVGDHHSCGLKTDGQLVCWGWDGTGEHTPPAGTFKQISAAVGHSCAVRTDGQLACWGWNTHGQTKPPAGTFTQVSSGSYFSCAVRTDHQVLCWGKDEHGETKPENPTTAVADSRANEILFEATVDMKVETTDDLKIQKLTLPQGFTIEPAFRPDHYNYRVSVPSNMEMLDVDGRFSTPFVLWAGIPGTRSECIRCGLGVRSSYTAYILTSEDLAESESDWNQRYSDGSVWRSYQNNLGFPDMLASLHRGSVKRASNRHPSFRTGEFDLALGETATVQIGLYKWKHGRFGEEPFAANTIKQVYTLTVTRPHPPSKPVPVENVRLSPTLDSVTVNWDASIGGYPPNRYIIRLKSVSDGKTRTRRIKADQELSVTFDALDAEATYQVSVRARNELGDSAWSHAQVTLPTTGDLSGLAISAGSLDFAYATTAYTVNVEHSVSSVTLTPATFHSDAAVTVDGEDPTAAVSLDYGANVIAVVITAPDGVATKTYTVTVNRPLPLRPGPPQNGQVEASTDTITVTWQEPTGGDDPSHYVARLRDADDGTEELQLNADARRAEFDGLKAGATYTVGVRAVNDGGDSDWAETRITLPEVTNLADLTISEGSLTFAYATTAYTVDVPRTVDSVTLTTAVFHPKTTVTVDGGDPAAPVSLDYGANVITVVVTAPDGVATQTYTVTVNRALPLKPGPPQNARGESATGSITITWQPPTSGDEPSHYVARLRNSDGSAEELRLDADARRAVFDGLEAGATYTVGVRAVNDGGESDWVERRITLPLPAALSSLMLIRQKAGQRLLTAGGTNLIADPAVTEYRIALAEDDLYLTLRPTAQRPASSAITVNGRSVASGGVVHVSRPGRGKTKVESIVVKEGGVERVYTLTVKRGG